MNAFALIAMTLSMTGSPAWDATIEPVVWEQVDRVFSFSAAVERERYTTLDRVGRIVFAVQRGDQLTSLEAVAARWRITQNDRVVASGDVSLRTGMAAITFALSSLQAGEFTLRAQLINAGQSVGEPREDAFTLAEAALPPQSGRVAIVLPRGARAPLSLGVPMPKAALWDSRHVRVEDADGNEVACDVTVRSRWGPTDRSSIRWLGIDFQPTTPDGYQLIFGPNVQRRAAAKPLIIDETEQGLSIDTGRLKFRIRKDGFNFFDDLRLDGRALTASTPKHGPYLVDHQGDVYRASLDREVTIDIEHRDDLRSVIRVEGWYIKEGTQGARLHYALPTDKLCKFVTRLEVYAGQPFVRVLHTWICTYDTYNVRLRDIGFALPADGLGRTWFGVEDAQPIAIDVPAEGAHLLQHLPHRFDVETSSGNPVADGKHSAG